MTDDSLPPFIVDRLHLNDDPARPLATPRLGRTRPGDHPRRRSTDVAPDDGGESHLGWRRADVAPVQAIPADCHPFARDLDPCIAYCAAPTYRRLVDDICATMRRACTPELHVHLVMGGAGAGRTTLARTLADMHAPLGKVDWMGTTHLFARPPSLVEALRQVSRAVTQATAEHRRAASDAGWAGMTLCDPRARHTRVPWRSASPRVERALAVIVDDAHACQPRVLRLLCGGLAWAATAETAIHLVLVGSPDVDAIVSPAVRRRVRRSWALTPYDVNGLREIVRAPLGAYGLGCVSLALDRGPDLLDADAITTLHRVSAGVPGDALARCARALERARADGSTQIEARHLRDR